MRFINGTMDSSGRTPQSGGSDESFDGREHRPLMTTASHGGAGIGARLLRKEDDRFLRGRGRFVADLVLAGMRNVAFVRAPIAHGRITALEIPEAARGQVFTADDLVGVKPIRAVSGLPGFKVSEQPVLASGKVRHVGEPIAACVAASRAEAEDLAAQVLVDFDELPPIADAPTGQANDAARVHEAWPDNIVLETLFDGDLSQARAQAAVSVTRTLRSARQCMVPLEGRGVVALWDDRMDQLVVHTATQMPHIVRNGLSDCLGLEQRRIRVAAPDVGGGFGYKGILLPEEVILGWLAMHLRHPVRWIEDRREELTGQANCREHGYQLTVHADADGRLLGVEAEAWVDAGAYSSYPFSACLEAAQIASILPGPYVLPAYRCHTRSVATNKPPILPYRGVARTGVCFALEVVLDAVARRLDLEPSELRLRNLVPPEQMPYDNITGKHFDSGNYPEALRRAVSAIDLPAVRARQRRGEPDGRLIGVGFTVFCEQGAHGTSVYAGWGIPMVPGAEQVQARFTPDGGLEIRIGGQSHGQSMETTLAQVAHAVLGVDIAAIRIVHGDTALSPYSTGTWGSRTMVMVGGAVQDACRRLADRAARIGAHLLQAGLESVSVGNGVVQGPTGSVSLAEVARTWFLRPQDLPAEADPGGLEVIGSYKPPRDTGTFSYAAHAVTVAVDPEIGSIALLDYVVVEDGGVLVNPMVVDGQVIGGVAQGIGTGLYEEMPYSDDGQPLASTLADYLLPGPTEVPALRIEHMETPSPYSCFGQKGIGESGAIGPPAAIANAVNDALRSLGAELTETPMTPRRVVAAIEAARARATGSGGKA